MWNCLASLGGQGGIAVLILCIGSKPWVPWFGGCTIRKAKLELKVGCRVGFPTRSITVYCKVLGTYDLQGMTNLGS